MMKSEVLTTGPESESVKFYIGGSRGRHGVMPPKTLKVAFAPPWSFEQKLIA